MLISLMELADLLIADGRYEIVFSHAFRSVEFVLLQRL